MVTPGFAYLSSWLSAHSPLQYFTSQCHLFVTLPTLSHFHYFFYILGRPRSSLLLTHFLGVLTFTLLISYNLITQKFTVESQLWHHFYYTAYAGVSICLSVFLPSNILVEPLKDGTHWKLGWGPAFEENIGTQLSSLSLSLSFCFLTARGWAASLLMWSWWFFLSQNLSPIVNMYYLLSLRSQSRPFLLLCLS